MTLWKDREIAHTFEAFEIMLRREKHLDVTSVGPNPTVSTVYAENRTSLGNSLS